MYIGGFALGQAGPIIEALLTATGAGASVFDTIERVINLFTLHYATSECSNNMWCHRIQIIEGILL